MDTEVETPEQALRDGNVERGAPHGTPITPEVVPDRRAETWPHDDVRRLTRAVEYLRTRNVAFALACGVCGKQIHLEGRNGAGDVLMGCGCCVRRWV